ncbi:DNA double-strand break repair helicase HerA [Candidatus Methanoperedenaceae archaeon GB50]|nr:DNA double-strand break repair helicase HerA [Candidatus Methanoperedenaceae archaeon GB37]CAD7777219.1 DNA double-strand break repair helicase HerA [Candidatus Methanoperedenaceae archaeon GB50]
MDNFRDNVVGRLLWAEADQNTRFKYTIWFDYTRRLMNDLHEGDLVAAPNFATDPGGIRYSILQLVTVMPIHYALGTDIRDLKGYPGFVMQAAKSASADWTEQETESYEDTTKIICEAIPTNLECDESGYVNQESSMAMVGKDVYVLTSEMTGQIFNRGIDKDIETVIEIGDLIRDKSVKVYVRVEDLIKTHFGIFGFTGVGKSNLTSTLVSNLLSVDEPIKIVLFDLMDEYTGLLADQILTHDGKIICLGEKTLMKPVFDYVNKPSVDKLDFAVNIFLKNILLPKGLKGEKIKFKPLIKQILQNEGIKIFEEVFTRTVEDFLNEIWSKVEGRFGPTKIGKLNKMKNDVFGSHFKDELTPELAQEFIEKLGFGEFRSQPIASVTEVLNESDLKESIRYNLVEPLKQIVESDKTQISENAKISIHDIINDLNDESKSSIYLVISHDPNKVRRFAYDLGRYSFWHRRVKGTISPLILLIFDEADQFIPGTPRSDTEKVSKSIIETLTRRGRKFGIGVGIATQRSAYLDTNIMGQLHTYLISKLPRKYDREVVGEAFSLSPDQFTQTFKFQKGQWLLVSHEATGIDMPIPIQAPNAEERMKKFLEEYIE